MSPKNIKSILRVLVETLITVYHICVENLPPHVEWDDRKVDCKGWLLMNNSVKLCIRMQ